MKCTSSIKDQRNLYALVLALKYGLNGIDMTIHIPYCYYSLLCILNLVNLAMMDIIVKTCKHP